MPPESKDEPRVVTEPVGAVLHEMVRGALTNQQVETSEHTEFYLINLLTGFSRADPEMLSYPLGPELLRASMLEPHKRYLRVKQIADTTLFLAGLFLDYLEAQAASTDYYFRIGSSAYLHLGTVAAPRVTDRAVAETYRDLGSRFKDFVRVLSRISDTELFPSNERILRLYERWANERGARDASRLLAMGVVPQNSDLSTKH
jgi:hypothetical protein